jgi:hypothetical protein
MPAGAAAALGRLLPEHLGDHVFIIPFIIFLHIFVKSGTRS